MNSFDKLLTEISWLYDKGYPDFSIKEDREALYDYLLSIGFPHSAVIELSERFIREEIDDETIIKYRDKDGESKEMRAGDAKRRKKDHPAKIEYDKLKGKDDKKEKPKGKKIGSGEYERELGDEPKAEPKVEPKVEPEDEPKDKSVQARIDAMKKDLEKKGLVDVSDDGSGVMVPNFPVKKAKNPSSKDPKVVEKRNERLGTLLDSLDKHENMGDDKELVRSGITKYKEGRVEEMSQEELEAIRRWVAVKKGKTAALYIADVKPNDWRKGKVSDKGRSVENRYSIPKSDDSSKYSFEYTKGLAEDLGLRQQPGTNSRTSSKDVDPASLTDKRKELKVKKNEDGSITFPAPPAKGKTYRVREVPDRDELSKSLQERGMSKEEADKKARIVAVGIERHNRAVREMQDMEIVDMGDVSTPEGKKQAMDNALNLVADKLQEKLEASGELNGPLSEGHYELIDMIKNVKSPTPPISGEDVKKYEEELGQILVKMEEIGDMQTSRAEVAEALTYCVRLSQGFEAYFPSDQTAKVSDVYALKQVQDYNNVEEVAESIQKILVEVEVTGGESVKFNSGAKSASADKVELTEYGDPATKQIIKDAFESYDLLYNAKPFPPKSNDSVYDDLKKSNDTLIDHLIAMREKHNPEPIKYGRPAKEYPMTKEGMNDLYDAYYQRGVEIAEKIMKNKKFAKKFQSLDDEGRQAVVKAMATHCAMGNMASHMNNADAEYNNFNNVSHSLNKTTKGIKYKKKEMDGVEILSGMNFSCDQGFTVSTNKDDSFRAIKPENKNPTAITPITRGGKAHRF